MKYGITVLSLVLFVSIGYFYKTYTNALRKLDPQSGATQVLSATDNHLMNVDSSITHSNLYSPSDLKAQDISATTIKLTWKFPKKEIVVATGLPPQYGTLSGYRIYRDGFWYQDIPLIQDEFIDSNLLPDEEYRYIISALTFDNKIEGSKSAELASRTRQGNPVSPIVFKPKQISTYLAEGDSITEGQRAAKNRGWVDQVSGYLAKKNSGLETVNYGLTGSTSDHVRSRLPQELATSSADLVTIAVGLNDLYGASRDIGNVSIAAYKNNLEQIIDKAGPSENRLVLLLTIYYFRDCCKQEFNKVDAWNKAIHEVGYTKKIGVIDAFQAMKDAGEEKTMDDILHPNQDGHDTIAKVAIETIRKYSEQ